MKAVLQVRFSVGYALVLVLLWRPGLAQGSGGDQAVISFPLVSADGVAAGILISAEDAPVVRRSAEMVAADVKAVSGRDVSIVDTVGDASRVMVIAGTIGRGGLADQLRKDRRIEVSGIEGQWETFAIRRVTNPVPGIESALVVVGSDPRGTAYGLLELSRKMGVSPWVWWADVPPPRQSSVELPNPEMTSKPPSVRYRGIFINDEDFGLRVWAAKTQDVELGNIGPRTYKRVFELLLRLRANTLWPAMHPGSRTFNATDENAKLAAEYGIVMGSSHAEPMLRNNVAEWNPKQRGAWDYEGNRPSVLDYWDERLKANGKFENIYTLGMRGIHDNAMPGSGTDADKAQLVVRIVADQRELLKQRVDPDVEKIPQVLWMYKEVLDLYRAGMVIPPDITLGWTDDNYGYIRQLSDKKERERVGGSGVYYHVSYWGAPHDYLWLCTTPPELIREEMSKAYDYDARKMWILNVGDIKPAEIDLDYFMQLAWDEPGTVALDQKAYLRRWVGTQFPPFVRARISEVLDLYYQLNFARKPEFMGFNRGNGAAKRTAFNPIAFGDQNLERRDAFHRLADEAEAIGRLLPQGYRDAFFELVFYPVKSAALMNDKALLQDEAALASAEGRASAPAIQAAAAEAYQSMQEETSHWQAIAGGKWSGIMSAAPHSMAVFGPVPTLVSGKQTNAEVGVAIEGTPEALGVDGDKAKRLAVSAGWWSDAGDEAARLPAFDRGHGGQKRFVDVFNTSEVPQHWSATTSQPWIRLDEASGDLSPASEQRMHVQVDWSQVRDRNVDGSIAVTVAGRSYTISVGVAAESAKGGMFVDNEGSISIGATHWIRETGNWRTYPDLSPSGEATGVDDTPETHSVEPNELKSQSPHLEYLFQLPAAGKPSLDIFVLPTFAANSERKMRYALSIDDGAPMVVESATSAWEENVLENSSVSKVALPSLSAGNHVLKFWYVDPGVFVQHFVLHARPGPDAYPVPPESRVDGKQF